MNINKNARRESISFWLGRGPSFKKTNTYTDTEYFKNLKVKYKILIPNSFSTYL